MFAELFISACAVAAVFSMLSSRMAVMVALPLLVWGAYRLGCVRSSPDNTQKHRAATPPFQGPR